MKYMRYAFKLGEEVGVYTGLSSPSNTSAFMNKLRQSVISHSDRI